MFFIIKRWLIAHLPFNMIQMKTPIHHLILSFLYFFLLIFYSAKCNPLALYNEHITRMARLSCIQSHKMPFFIPDHMNLMMHNTSISEWSKPKRQGQVDHSKLHWTNNCLLHIMITIKASTFFPHDLALLPNINTLKSIVNQYNQAAQKHQKGVKLPTETTFPPWSFVFFLHLPNVPLLSWLSRPLHLSHFLPCCSTFWGYPKEKTSLSLDCFLSFFPLPFNFNFLDLTYLT